MNSAVSEIAPIQQRCGSMRLDRWQKTPISIMQSHEVIPPRFPLSTSAPVVRKSCCRLTSNQSTSFESKQRISLAVVKVQLLYRTPTLC